MQNFNEKIQGSRLPKVACPVELLPRTGYMGCSSCSGLNFGLLKGWAKLGIYVEWKSIRIASTAKSEDFPYQKNLFCPLSHWTSTQNKKLLHPEWPLVCIGSTTNTHISFSSEFLSGKIRFFLAFSDNKQLFYSAANPLLNSAK